ncbi:MAG: GGDEF domain-containing protein [Alphaproteobacteria bacterium]
MHYPHSSKQATLYASKTFERVQKDKLTPHPDNFELWYVYYAKLDPEVVRAIDLIQADGKTITDDHCRDIHARFLSDTVEQERVLNAGDKIQKTISNVYDLVADVKESATQYNVNLSESTGNLHDDLSPQEINRVLQSIMANTEDMIKHNQVLEDELNKSFEAMQELQRDLEVVRREALTDGLTNVSNRKAFDSELERTILEAQASNQPLSLIMLDIDHFKVFNDTYGHQIGDQVLRLVARTLIEGVKGRDMAARFGGEEFAIILPDTGLQGAFKVADALRKAVASKEVINRSTGGTLGRITMSGGVAQYIAGETLEDMLARADEALYAAKNAGRNQIISADNSV